MLKRLAVLAVLMAVPFTTLRAADVVEQVLVRINGDILTKTEFEQRQITALRQRPELANVTPDSPELKKAIAEITPQLVLDAVDELLLVQRGRELGYKMGDDQFNSILANIKKTNNLDDDTKFQAALKSEGMTMSDLRAQLEKQMLVQNVMSREVAQKISINDDEAKAYYESHKQEFSTPASITLREILIKVPTVNGTVNAAADDAAKEKADDIRNRLMGGEPFARLAAEVSDSGSKANGGLIGPISHDELAPDLQKLIDGMKVGDLTQPLRTPQGYQILKLEERADVKVKSFDEARNDIGNKIGDQKLAGEREKYLDRLRDQATIVWRNDELKKAYEQALAARPRG
jgi:peptidyl-prolyl cis-trans isomerase SurA